MKRLANIKKPGASIEVTRGITEDEGTKLINAFDMIASFRSSNKYFENVVNVHQEVIQCVTNNSTGLDRLISEYLSSFSAFLNYWKWYLDKTFGGGSTNLKVFKAATSLEFDNHFAYRFLYELRNYIHHCGFPAMLLGGQLLEDETKGYSLILDVSILNSSFKWHPMLKADFLHRSCKVEILILLAEAINCLYRINNVAINNSINLHELYIACNTLTPYKNMIKNDEYELAIVEYLEWHEPQSPQKMSITIFPFYDVNHILSNITISG